MGGWVRDGVCHAARERALESANQLSADFAAVQAVFKCWPCSSTASFNTHQTTT